MAFLVTFFAGFFQQLERFLQSQRSRLAILGDLAVELAVADVRAEAAVQDLDVVPVPFLDDAVARDLFLFLDQEYRAGEVDGVRIVLLLQRGVGTAALGERPEAADADADLRVIVCIDWPGRSEANSSFSSVSLSPICAYGP